MAKKTTKDNKKSKKTSTEVVKKGYKVCNKRAEKSRKK